jgi:hypothetical protein
MVCASGEVGGIWPIVPGLLKFGGFWKWSQVSHPANSMVQASVVIPSFDIRLFAPALWPSVAAHALREDVNGPAAPGDED